MGSALLFEACAGALRTLVRQRSFNDKVGIVVCRVCGDGDETTEYLILNCAGLVSLRQHPRKWYNPVPAGSSRLWGRRRCGGHAHSSAYKAPAGMLECSGSPLPLAARALNVHFLVLFCFLSVPMCCKVFPFVVPYFCVAFGPVCSHVL